MNSAFERLLLLLFPILGALLLWEVLFGGRLLLPAAFLQAFSPWNSSAPADLTSKLPQWNVLQWDGMAEFYPWRLHAAREMSAGRIPLWNPNVLCGTPFLANSQSAPLYPLHCLLYLPGAEDRITVAVRMGWLAWLHLSIAGIGAYLLSREFRCRPCAARLAGTAFMLSGFSVAWLELPSFIAVTCWIPYVLLAVARAARLGSSKWTLAGAMFVGLMLLAGHLQIALYGLIAAGGFWLWETVRLARGNRAWRGALLAGAVIIGGGLLLAAPQLLPSLELSRMSHRAGAATAAGYEGYLKLAMPLHQLIGLLVPDFFGLPTRGDFWGNWSYGPPNVQEYAGSVGLLAFGLALLGLWAGRALTSGTVLAGLTAGLAILLAVGSPLNAVLYFGLPGFAQSGSPARVLVLFCLAQAMLAGIGTECLLRRTEGDWRAVFAPLLIAAAVALAIAAGLAALAGALLPPQMSHAIAEIGWPAVGRAALAAGVGVGLIALLAWLLRNNPAPQRAPTVAGAAIAGVAGYLLMTHGALNPNSAPNLAYPDTALTTILAQHRGRVATVNTDWHLFRTPKAVLPPNSAIAYNWREVQGYDSLYLRSYRSLMNAVTGLGQDASPPANGNIVFLKGVDSPLFPLLGAGLVVSEFPLRLPRFQAASVEPPYVHLVPKALPEAYVMSGRFTAADGPGLERLRQDLSAGTPWRVLLAADSGAPAGETPEASRPVAAAIRRPSPGHITVDVPAGSTGVITLAEGYAPGWRATLRLNDGRIRSASVLRANVAFQAVMVDPEVAGINWRYEPGSFRAGLFLAGVAIAALAVMALVGCGGIAGKAIRPQRKPRRHRAANSLPAEGNSDEAAPAKA